jgi:hypothetical protein
MGDMVQCLLIDANLQRDMWGEAIRMAVMLYNRTPSVGNGGKTPYELYYSVKPGQIWRMSTSSGRPFAF